jgi:hypothetical protein
MKKISWLFRRSNEESASARIRRIAGCIGVAVLVATTGIAMAQNQNPSPGNPFPAAEPQMNVPPGYAMHGSVDVGGRMANIKGAGAMYDTLVNLESGPRVQGETFEMHALPSNKHSLFDNLSAFSNGFGGDPYNFSSLNFSKGKYYEFSGTFNRDRQYFDYDELANPNIVSGLSIPISGSSTPYSWPQVADTPFLYNTVRRRTDTNLTLFPVSRVTYRFGYAQNIFQGPSLTPSGNSVAGSEVLLQEFQRNSTDDFTGEIDWKPVRGTQLTFEEEIDHFKGDSYFVMDPAYFTVQEADGMKVALLYNYQNSLPYGYSGATGAFAPNGNGCNGSSMINPSTILRANPSGGLPIIDPACSVISSYFRSQPTRAIFPTEIFRFQSASIRNISMNGDVRYTNANMNLPNYYEDFQGLSGANRELAYAGFANAKRQVMAADYGIVWQASQTVSLEDQVNFSNVHQPGTSGFTSGTAVTVPTTAGADTINNANLTSKAMTTGSRTFSGSPGIGSTSPGYFGQRLVTNNATVSWDATPRSTFSLTYRVSHDVITEGANISATVDTGVCPAAGLQAFCGTVTINESGGIFNAALRPAANWNINGSVEVFYADNAFTAVAPRQTKQYRVHTMYKPKPWATITGAYNDLERHNNTNNTGASGPYPSATYDGPLDHVDHSRVVALGADLLPNEHYGLDLNYSYSDVYASTNTCFQGAAVLLPGGAVDPGGATQSGQLCTPIASSHGSVAALFGPTPDYMDAPTEYGSVSLALSPDTKLHSDIGYRISSVNSSEFYVDARDVAGSLISTYQSPFVNVAWTVHPGLIWRAEYNYYGYGEGGPNGAQWCNDNPSPVIGTAGPVPVVPCSSVPNTEMNGPAYGYTAPRNFHANNVTMGMHYQF